MKVDIYSQKGSKVNKKIELKDSVFGIEPNEHTVYLVVKAEQAAKRQGTSKSKNKAEVRGTGSKPYKQKGTGRARVGRIRNPSRVSGGTAFGPEVRTYRLKINKKVKTLARKSILSSKLSSKSLIVIDKLALESYKTKDFCKILKNLELDSKKATFLIGEKNENILKSSRNIHNVNVFPVDCVSSYDLINNSTLVIDQASVKYFNEI